MTDKNIADRRKERQAIRTKRTVATVIAIVLVAACIACICVIGVTVVNTYLPDSHTTATEVTKLGMLSADNRMQTATQASAQDMQSSQPTAATQDASLHCYAYGKTSYGYDWDYRADSDIVKVDCQYDFNTHSYDLIVSGKAPGTANLTLYYFTDDNTKAAVPMTVKVDENLNITQI